MISDVLFKNPNLQDAQIACKTDTEEVTYAELKKRICKLSCYLLGKGCKVEERILIWLNNSVEQLVSYFAVNMIGCVAVFVDTKFRQEIYDILKDNQISLVITTKKQMEQFQKDNIHSVIFVDEKTQDVDDFISFENYLSKQNICKEQLSTILYTSGSTGKPKGVLNSHENLEEALKNYTETMKFTAEDTFIGVAPFFHSYAFDSCMLAALYSGGKLILMSSFVPGKVLRMIQEERATILHAVPFMYQLLNDQLSRYSYDVSSLRICISAGSKIDSDCLRLFYKQTGHVIHQEYGSTETGTIAINLSNDIEKAIKYVGQPLHNVECKLIPYDEEGNKTLMVISKGVSLGYLGEPRFEREGYLTQDLCVIEDSYICITGRADRLINITGLKVNPIEIERCLKEHPDIEDAFVKGRQSKNFGEMIEAVLVRKTESLTTSEIENYCRRNLAAYKVPSVITWVEKIEKSGLGKSRFV